MATQALTDLSIALSPKKNKAKDSYVNSLAGNSATNPRQPSSSLTEMSSALSPRPETPDYYAKSRSVMDDYIDSLMPSKDENDISTKLGNLRSSVSSGIQQASEQAIPMGFITGQQQSIENRGLNAMQPYENELARLAAERQAKSEGLLARQGFETSLADTMLEDARYQDEMAIDERRYAYDVAQKASEPIEIGGRLLQRNPDGGLDEIYTPPPATPEPFELSEGQSRYEYNPETGEYEQIASKGKTYKLDSDGSSSDRTSQIIDGFITFDDLTLAERQKVQDELYELGFADSKVPAWFSEYYKDTSKPGSSSYDYPGSPAIMSLTNGTTSGKPPTLQEAWNKYRTETINKAKAKSGSSDEIDFDAIPG